MIKENNPLELEAVVLTDGSEEQGFFLGGGLLRISLRTQPPFWGPPPAQHQGYAEIKVTLGLPLSALPFNVYHLGEKMS